MSGKLLVCCVHGNPSLYVGAWRPYLLSKFAKTEKFESKFVHMRGSHFSWVIEIIRGLCWLKDGVFVYSAGPFVELPIIILLLGVFWRSRFIFDLRDGFSLNILLRQNNKTSLKSVAATLIERVIYWRCSKFIVTTEGNFEFYKKSLGAKVVLIPNGHTLKKRFLHSWKRTFYADKDTLNAVCFGKFFEYGKMADASIGKLSENFKEFKRVRLHIVGSSKGFRSEVSSGKDNVELVFHSRLRYSIASRLVSKMDLGICVLRDPNVENGTKIFDYIGLGIPVLNIDFQGTSFFRQFHSFMVEDGAGLFAFLAPSIRIRKSYSRTFGLSRFFELVRGLS